MIVVSVRHLAVDLVKRRAVVESEPVFEELDMGGFVDRGRNVVVGGLTRSFREANDEAVAPLDDLPHVAILFYVGGFFDRKILGELELLLEPPKNLD